MFEALIIVGFGAFFAGASVASYLLVCASRIEAKAAGASYSEDSYASLLTSKRSHCPSCSKPLAFYELIPVLSYISQLGACRNCGSAIGWVSPTTEAMAGVSAVLLALAALGVPLAPPEALLTSGLLILALTLLLIFKGFLPNLKVTVGMKVNQKENKKNF